MDWRESLTSILLKAGHVSLKEVINVGANRYLAHCDIDSSTDPVLLIRSIIEVWGPKILDSKKIRIMMLERLTQDDLKNLSKSLRIKLAGDSPGQAVRQLSSFTWNWRTQKVKNFCNFFNIEEVLDDYNDLSSYDAAIEAPEKLSGRESEDRFFEMHTFQSDVRDQLLENYIISHEQKLLLCLPTGGGKTRVALHTVIKFLMSNTHSRKSILWLAYEPLLLDQALGTFLKLWPVLGVGDIKIRRIYDKYNDKIDDAESAIYFASVQSLKNKLNDKTKDLLKKNLLITVFDEAHQVVAPQAKAIVNSLLHKNEEIKFLGLTATPGRSHLNPLENEQFRNYFSKSIQIKTPPKKTSFGDLNEIADKDRSAITYLQEIGVLAKLNHVVLEYGMTKQATCTQAYGKDCYSQATLKKLSRDPRRNERIIKELSELIAENKKVLVFACSVEHAEDLCFMLKLKNINAGLVLGVNKDVRDKTIHKFRFTDELNVLINYGVLTTGFDAPEIDALLIARPTSSLITYSQMLGRALRGSLNGGHETNTVINVSDPIFGEENEAYNKFKIYWRDYA